MQRERRVYLWDLQRALEEIALFTSGKTLESYRGECILQLAIEREFIIIGGVISKILGYFTGTQKRADDARRIVGFRHILVHDHANINDETVWQILTVSGPILKRQVGEWPVELDRHQP